MITAAFISAVIGNKLPGHGSVYLSQALKFRAPVRPGDTVRVSVRVVEGNRERLQNFEGVVLRVRNGGLDR